ncbi:hypothetical protein MVEN_02347300 [Mycena venus]|uniref:Uncharacterized protein n=1 Tax=Mycena venus TaxID=2733690 RepID=A0A8H6X2X1_9AGAR|nr:hypothetical protein MVEN_02347300 [Mycena venus]
MTYTDSRTSWDLMVSLFSETAVVLLLYGFYISLFLLSIHILSRRQKGPGIKVLIVTSCVMAILGTIQVAIIVTATAINARFVEQIESYIFAANDFVANSLFLYRCYVIWGFQWKITVLPVMFMLCTFIVAILWGEQLSNSSAPVRLAYGMYSLGIATILLLTSLTAGRILWIQRAASHAGLDSTIRRRYSIVIRILLESGAVYCIVAISLAITVSRSEGDSIVHYMVIGIAGQLENIVPTFTLVYIGLKNTVDNGPAQSKDPVPGQHTPPRRTGRVAKSCSQSDWPILDIKAGNGENGGECV